MIKATPKYPRLSEFSGYKLNAEDFLCHSFRYLTLVNEWEKRVYAHGTVMHDELIGKIPCYLSKKDKISKAHFINSHLSRRWVGLDGVSMTIGKLIEVIYKMCLESPDKKVYLEMAVDDRKAGHVHDTPVCKTFTYVLKYLYDEEVSNGVLVHRYELYCIDDVKILNNLEQLWELKYPNEKGYVPRWEEDMFELDKDISP